MKAECKANCRVTLSALEFMSTRHRPVSWRCDRVMRRESIVRAF